MLAPGYAGRTVGGMAADFFPLASTDVLSARSPGAVQDVDVLAAVADALHLRGQDDDWAVLEAWAAALTLVTWAALRFVPEELHDFL
jgi:hypothetical protein